MAVPTPLRHLAGKWVRVPSLSKDNVGRVVAATVAGRIVVHIDDLGERCYWPDEVEPIEEASQ